MLVCFQRCDQDVQLNLFVNSPAELELAVIEGKLDLAIPYFSRSRSSLKYRLLYRKEIGVFYSDCHLLFAEMQPTLKWITACGWVMHGFLPESLVPPLCPSRSRATVYHTEAVAYVVLVGTHLGYLPAHCAGAWIECGRVRTLLPERLSCLVEYSTIVYARHPLSEAAHTFIDDLLRVHGLGA